MTPSTLSAIATAAARGYTTAMSDDARSRRSTDERWAASASAVAAELIARHIHVPVTPRSELRRQERELRRGR